MAIAIVIESPTAAGDLFQALASTDADAAVVPSLSIASLLSRSSSRSKESE